MIISPRFFGDDTLASCLGGHRMFAGSGDPPEAVALVQRALEDLGFTVDVNGAFDSETEDAVTAYKTGKGLTPNDPVVGPGTMAALDADFAHELFDAKANDIAGTRFDLGDRIGTRTDLVDGFATCDFQNGISVEVGHVCAYAMPATVQAAWTAAGGLGGTFGLPTSDPMEVDAARFVQEFELVAFVFGDQESFAIPRAIWEASIAGGSMIGAPLGSPQAVGAGGASFVQHDQGVVLAGPETSPQPLPQAVFDLWSAQEAAGTSLGPPTAFAFPTAAGNIFPFLLGSITLSDAGVVSISGATGADLLRYFQPEDIDQFLLRRVLGENATALIGGDVAFARMRDDIARAIGRPGSFVYILSWHCNVDLQLVPGDPASTLRSLLVSCASFGTQIRAMLWAGDPVPSPPLIGYVVPVPTPVGPIAASIPWKLAKDYAKTKTSRVVNEPAVSFINGLLASGKDAAAILDDRHLLVGSHHQKAIIVGFGGGELIAYVGGIEPNRDRIEQVPGEDGSPLFDISVKLEGAGAWQVLRTFVNRWNLHPNKVGAPLLGDAVAEPLPAGGPLAVQVTHTYGRGFPFIKPVKTASTAIANGIKNAKRFFYMEDQYFVGSPKMTDAIRDALSSNTNLVGIIVIAAEFSVSDLPDLPFRRRAFLRPIVNSFPGRFLVFERLGGGSPIGPTAYVHSKLLIVDDEAAFIGSVNSNRRSWFHDSEIDATIVDTTGQGGAAPGTRGWVRDFRCNLWSKHFGLNPALLGDFDFCLTVWQTISDPNSGNLIVLGANVVNISSVISVRPYNVGAGIFTVAAGNTLVAGTTVTVSSTAGLFVGQGVDVTGGTGTIPVGTTIASITDVTNYVLSAAATAGTPILTYYSAVPRYSILGVPVANKLLELAWNTLEDPT